MHYEGLYIPLLLWGLVGLARVGRWRWGMKRGGLDLDSSLLERLSPVELGKVVDKRMDGRDLVALIFDWARRGILTMAEVRRRDGVLDFLLTKVKDLPERAADYERVFLDGIFPHDCREVKVSDLVQIRVNQGMKAAKERLNAHMVQHGLVTEDPKGLLAVVRWLGVAVLVTMSGWGIGTARGDLLVGGILIWLWCFYGARPAVEAFMVHGDKTLIREVRGFRRALAGLGPEDLRRRLNDEPAFFERMLPVAVAFALGERWLKQFAGVLSKAPAWYRLEAETGEGSREERVRRLLGHLAYLIKMLERAAFYASFMEHQAPNFAPARGGRWFRGGGSGGSSGGIGGFGGGGSSGGGMSTGGGGGW